MGSSSSSSAYKKSCLISEIQKIPSSTIHLSSILDAQKKCKPNSNSKSRSRSMTEGFNPNNYNNNDCNSGGAMYFSSFCIVFIIVIIMLFYLFC